MKHGHTLGNPPENALATKTVIMRLVLHSVMMGAALDDPKVIFRVQTYYQFDYHNFIIKMQVPVQYNILYKFIFSIDE